MNIEDIQATLGEIERKAAAGAALREDLGKIGDRLAALEMRNTDLEQMLASGNRRGGSAERGTPEQREHLEVFKKWLRNPKSSRIRGELEVAETKAASGLTDTAGGALVPELILGELNRRVKDGSPMRQLANVMDVASGDMKYPIGNNDATSGWVGETDTRAATGEPTIESRTPTGGTVYAYIKATEELLQDSRFPIDEWFVNAVTDEIISTEGAAFISGNGTKKPTGLLNAVPEDDVLSGRTAGAMRYIASGDADSLFPALIASGGDYDWAGDSGVLVQTVYRLKTGYRRNATWLMNSATAANVRELKDLNGRFVWADGLAAGQPARLLGYPVELDENMPDIAADEHPIIFGDFRRGYGIFDLGDIRVTVDDNITEPGMVKWYIRRRVFGTPLDTEAMIAVKCAES